MLAFVLYYVKCILGGLCCLMKRNFPSLAYLWASFRDQTLAKFGALGIMPTVIEFLDDLHLFVRLEQHVCNGLQS